jgi:hypothetical protein
VPHDRRERHRHERPGACPPSASSPTTRHRSSRATTRCSARPPRTPDRTRRFRRRPGGACRTSDHLCGRSRACSPWPLRNRYGGVTLLTRRTIRSRTPPAKQTPDSSTTARQFRGCPAQPARSQALVTKGNRAPVREIATSNDPAGEGVDLRVSLLEADVADVLPGGELPGQLEHPRREVHAQHRFRPDGPAASRTAWPVPQPMSSTCSPALRRAPVPGRSNQANRSLDRSQPHASRLAGNGNRPPAPGRRIRPPSPDLSGRRLAGPCTRPPRRDTPPCGTPTRRELPAVTKNRNYPQPVKHLKPMALRS